MAVVELMMDVETVDIVFVLGRVATSIVLLLSAVLALRLISIYKGGILRKPWLILLTGIVIFSLAQLVSAFSAIFEVEIIRMAAAIVSLAGSLVIFFGLLQLVNAWGGLTR
jgi:hypothetical protein